MSSEDLATRFVSFGDRTNRSRLGPAVFGTNWVRNGIRVREGQVVLARLAADHTKVYALKFAKQTLTNAEVFYIQTPPMNQLPTGSKAGRERGALQALAAMARTKGATGCD